MNGKTNKFTCWFHFIYSSLHFSTAFGLQKKTEIEIRKRVTVKGFRRDDSLGWLF